MLNQFNQAIFGNSIDADTGRFFNETTASELREHIVNKTDVDELSQWEPFVETLDKYPNGVKRGTVEDVDELLIHEAGWGLVFAADDPEAKSIQEDLKELIHFRREQAGSRFRIFDGEDGYKKGESHAEFLARFGVSGDGPVDPRLGAPYYLLLVGSPALIPFDFQYHLDVSFGVGRICFNTSDAYKRYASAVVAAASGSLVLPPNAAFIGFHHSNDKNTDLSKKKMVIPLANELDGYPPHWTVERFMTPETTKKEQLLNLLRRDAPPALLFSAGHGVRFSSGNEKQKEWQGALLCGDWPGPQNWKGSLPGRYYLGAPDLDDRVQLGGVVAFLFACYSGGTPGYSDFSRRSKKGDLQKFNWKRRANRSIISALPQKMLSHPNGSALAIIAHVDECWSYSFWSEEARTQTTVFDNTLKRLAKGQPVGFAMEYVNNRFAQLASQLLTYLDYLEAGLSVDDAKLLACWCAHHDARNYIVLGDPAVCLATGPVAKSPAIDTAPSQNIRMPNSSHALGSPVSEISQADWEATPPAVKQYILSGLRKT